MRAIVTGAFGAALAAGVVWFIISLYSPQGFDQLWFPYILLVGSCAILFVVDRLAV